MARDLTKGGIFKNLLVVSVPTMVGMSFQMIYDLVDIFWVGQISSKAIAGVTIFATIFWVVEALNEIIGVSSVSIISQAYGKKDRERTNLAIEQTIAFKFAVAVIAVVLMFPFLKPLMNIFGEKDVVDLGLQYGYLRLLFLPIMFSSFSVNTALRCVGDAKTPMKIMILVSFLNLILDPVLMFDTIPYIGLPGFGLGLFGASLATVISQTIAFGIGFYIVFSGKHGIAPSLKGLFKLNKEIDQKLLKIGLPNGIEVFFRQSAMAIILKFVSFFGTYAVAAYGVAGRLFGFAFMPIMGFMMGGSAIVGQNLGAEEVDRARKTAYTASVFNACVMFLFTLLAVFAGREVISIFNKTPQVINLGAGLLQYGALGLIFLGIGFGFGTLFSGSGYNYPFLISGIVARWIVQIPFLFIFITILKYPIIWIWLSFMFSDIAEFLVALYFFKKGKWQHRRV